MTARYCHSTSKNTNRGLGSSGASVERPISCDSSNYTLRYCVAPESPDTPAIHVNSHGVINNLQHPRSKLNAAASAAFSVFEVVEVVRPFSGAYSKTPHQESISSSRLKVISAPSVHRLLTSSSSPATCDDSMHRPEGRQSQRNSLPLSKSFEHDLPHELSTSSRTMGRASIFSDIAPAKSIPNRKADGNGDHNGYGFKRKSGNDYHGSVSAGSFQTKAGARPWHQTAEPIPMKYFMNGVRMLTATASPLDVFSPVASLPHTASMTTLRPSLFSLRRHHDGLSTSLTALLQTPERQRMTKQAALDFIQGQVDVWYAACQGDNVLVAAYIDAGVLVDALDRRYGRTPLQYASGNNNTAVMRLLLQAGACVHSDGSRDKHRNTPLHFAALYGKTDAACYLLDNGADCMGINANGLTPLQLALANCHMDIVALLKKYGGDSLK